MGGAVNPAVEAQAKLAQAEEQRQLRNLDRAREICEGLIKRYPDYVGALHTLGLVLADSGDFVGALGHLVRASMLNSRDWRTLTALSGVYLKLGAHLPAARTLQQALKSKPNDVNTLSMLAQIYDDDEEYELAAETYQKVIELEPSLHRAQIGLGESYMNLGLFAEAAIVFETLFSKGVRPLRVCYNIGQLPALLSNTDILSHLDSLSPDKKQATKEFETRFAFTRASALDKVGRYDEAWENLVFANGLKYQLARNDYLKKHEFRQRILAQLKQFRDQRVAGRELEKGVPTSLFILGPSRCGKTTMERLVGALDGVKRGYENKICDNVVRRVFQSSGLLANDLMSAMGPGMQDMFRQFYKEELAERVGGAAVFTITTPGLIIDSLAIANVVPNSRLMFIKRNIDDIAIRIFMKQYEADNSHSYSIDTIHEYVGWYNEIIDLCIDRLPDVSRVLRYEDVISDPKCALSVAAELCGLQQLHASPLPQLGDDRDCGRPYKEHMTAARKSDFGQAALP